jgi:hypothetical protein
MANKLSSCVNAKKQAWPKEVEKERVRHLPSHSGTQLSIISLALVSDICKTYATDMLS